MATHSSILAWRNPWTEDHGGLQSRIAKESDTTEQLSRAQRSVYPSIPVSQFIPTLLPLPW